MKARCGRCGLVWFRCLCSLDNRDDERMMAILRVFGPVTFDQTKWHGIHGRTQ